VRAIGEQRCAMLVEPIHRTVQRSATAADAF
jgi:hypothetical protein